MGLIKSFIILVFLITTARVTVANTLDGEGAQKLISAINSLGGSCEGKQFSANLEDSELFSAFWRYFTAISPQL